MRYAEKISTPARVTNSLLLCALPLYQQWHYFIRLRSLFEAPFIRQELVIRTTLLHERHPNYPARFFSEIPRDLERYTPYIYVHRFRSLDRLLALPPPRVPSAVIRIRLYTRVSVLGRARLSQRDVFREPSRPTTWFNSHAFLRAFPPPRFLGSPTFFSSSPLPPSRPGLFISVASVAGPVPSFLARPRRPDPGRRISHRKPWPTEGETSLCTAAVGSLAVLTSPRGLQIRMPDRRGLFAHAYTCSLPDRTEKGTLALLS